MAPGSYLIIFCTLAFISLTAVSLVNRREEHQRRLRQRQRQLRFQLQNLEDLVLAIGQLVENRRIARLLNDELLATILAARTSEPDDSHLHAMYQTALARHEDLGPDPLQGSLDIDRFPSLDRLKHSDADIARSKRKLADCLLTLRRQQRNGQLPLDELRLLQLELSWASLMVEVISLLGQGHKSVRRGEVFAAHAFYKKAQLVLMQSSHPDPRRQQFIREISELLQGKRRSISPQLMPETALNPDASAEAQLLDLPDAAELQQPGRPANDDNLGSLEGMEGLAAWQH